MLRRLPSLNALKAFEAGARPSPDGGAFNSPVTELLPLPFIGRPEAWQHGFERASRACNYVITCQFVRRP
jgi:hypothetical protein